MELSLSTYGHLEQSAAFSWIAVPTKLIYCYPILNKLLESASRRKIVQNIPSIHIYCFSRDSQDHCHGFISTWATCLD